MHFQPDFPKDTTKGVLQCDSVLGLCGVVLGKVFMAVSVLDGLGRVGDSKAPGSRLSVHNVLGASVDGEVGLLVDDSSSLGVSTSAMDRC
jgi:hypothetical protein